MVNATCPHQAYARDAAMDSAPPVYHGCQCAHGRGLPHASHWYSTTGFPATSTLPTASPGRLRRLPISTPDGSARVEGGLPAVAPRFDLRACRKSRKAQYDRLLVALPAARLRHGSAYLCRLSDVRYRFLPRGKNIRYFVHRINYRVETDIKVPILIQYIANK